MKKYLFVFTIVCMSCNSNAQIPSKVDFDAFEKLTKEVNVYRKDRLINWTTFQQYAKEENTIILDARSKEMFDRKHVKGAINLNFSDFTQGNLEAIIPALKTRILIYCNNNFDNDPINFASKMYTPRPVVRNGKGLTQKATPISLALNVPTFINLYGYGYKNVYELSELMSVLDEKIVFEGTDVPLIEN